MSSFLQHQGLHWQGQDHLAIQGQDLQMGSSRIVEARCKGEHNWGRVLVFSLLLTNRWDYSVTVPRKNSFVDSLVIIMSGHSTLTQYAK